jgi:Glycosyl hydrolase family 71
MRFAGALFAALAAASMVALPRPVPAEAAAHPVPLYAYYYIWYDQSSWSRAKSDLPVLGRYSSDHAAVMARHIDLAKQAGIDGFIVSWKSTEVLNSRLDQLIRIAVAKQFKLAIIYESLDFHRNPLPLDRVRRDLNEFATRYAHSPAFDTFDLPLVIWSGTWRYTAADVATVTRPLRDRLMILASEHSPAGYQRLAGLVDGNAYYWSSVDPRRTPRYREKLAAMQRVVHADQGLWIAPVAPGYDARKLGGKRVVQRREGATLREEMDAAIASSPDALGLISWNEFSEGSYVEPSVRYGRRYLDVLASLQRPQGPGTTAGIDFASDLPDGSDASPGRFVVLGSLLLGTVGSLAVLIRRVGRSAGPTTDRRGNRS